jgi:hypothetical protein
VFFFTKQTKEPKKNNPMGPYIIILVVIAIVTIVFITRSKAASVAPAPSPTSNKESQEGQEQKLVNKDILFNSLVKDGYTRKNSSYSIKFSKSFDEAACNVEMEVSLVKNNKGDFDIDVYKQGFSIHLPENISASFFEHVVFQNYNKMLKETTNMELLPTVQDNGYFLRSSSKHPDWKLPSYSTIQPAVEARLSFFDEFPFITQEDYDHTFFQNLLEDGYQTVFEPQQMLIRFSKPIGKDNLSFYYVKALQMVFLASSKLTSAEIQEDFKDDETKLHHFTKEEIEAVEAVEAVEEEDFAEDKPSDLFPSFKEFKEKETEFISQDSEEVYDEEE